MLHMLAFGTTLFILWSILWISENTLVNAIHLNVYHAKSVPILLMKKSKEIQYAINLGITFKYHINFISWNKDCLLLSQFLVYRCKHLHNETKISLKLSL